MTSIAALQCVERGLVALDDDVSGILDEFRDIGIITGFDKDRKPVLKPAERKMNLRYVTGLLLQFTHPASIERRFWGTYTVSQLRIMSK